MTENNSQSESSVAAASAVGTADGVESSAAGLDSVGVASLALQANAVDPAVARELGEFLSTQRSLAEKQSLLLDHRLERADLEKEHIKAQNQHLHMQHLHDKLRLVLEVGLATLGAAVLIGIIWTLYGAATDRSIVVNTFVVSPKLENVGVSGATVAGQFLDELIRLRESARADIAKRAVIDSLAEQVQIEIPEVHVSFGELRRLLHEALGHRTEIRGEMTDSPDGLALTLRGTNLPARTFYGKLENVPSLVTQAAEYASEHSDPVQMAYYLHRTARPEEAIALIRRRFASVSREEQAILLNVWGNVLATSNRLPEAIVKYRAAIKLNPRFWYPYFNLVSFLSLDGREEESLEVGREFEQVSRRGKLLGLPEDDLNFVDVDALRMDFPRTIREALLDYNTSGGFGTSGWPLGPVLATYYGLQHDASAAKLILETNPDSAGGQGAFPSAAVDTAAARGTLAFESDAYVEAAEYWDDWDRGLASPSAKSIPYLNRYPRQRCWLPIVYEMAGRRGDADAAIASTKDLTNADCYRFRADVFDHRGDWVQAEETYAAGVARTPSLPHVYFSWGTALAGHQQYAAAIEKLAAAHARGPHWADPLKVWGDVLLKQGNAREALAKYDEALEYAPNWPQLKEAREAAAKQKN
jgi:tetratricopeptide (TPR) repeat protein